MLIRCSLEALTNTSRAVLAAGEVTTLHLAAHAGKCQWHSLGSSGSTRTITDRFHCRLTLNVDCGFICRQMVVLHFHSVVWFYMYCWIP